jgi:hypothetical protein
LCAITSASGGEGSPPCLAPIHRQGRRRRAPERRRTGALRIAGMPVVHTYNLATKEHAPRGPCREQPLDGREGAKMAAERLQQGIISDGGAQRVGRARQHREPWRPPPPPRRAGSCRCPPAGDRLGGHLEEHARPAAARIDGRCPAVQLGLSSGQPRRGRHHQRSPARAGFGGWPTSRPLMGRSDSISVPTLRNAG